MAIPRKRFRTIGADVEKIVKPILSGRGFGATTIVNSWVDVVGTILAKHTFPEKISYPNPDWDLATNTGAAQNVF